MPNPTLRSLMTPCVDSIERWESFNPIIPAGTMCIVVMGGGELPKTKVGDGTSRFTELPWSSIDPDSQKDLIAHGISFVCESWRAEDGLSWYRKYSDGWLEQGGVFIGATWKTWITVNLPVPFATNDYTLVTSTGESTISLTNTNTATYSNCFILAGVLKEKTASNFTGIAPGPGKWASWRASGYAASL